MNPHFPPPKTSVSLPIQTPLPPPIRTRKRLIINLVFIFGSLYIAAFLVLASAQRTFMYHPERGDEAKFLQMAKTQNVEPWRDDNKKLIGWKRTAESRKSEHRVLDVQENVRAKNRLLILHGNGGHALSRTYFMDGFAALDDGKTWEFYALEYPGYGWRDGEHTESEIVADAEKALLQSTKNDSRPVFIAGESLGTGVACLLAAKYPDLIRGLFLATPYTSTVDVAQGRFPIFPVGLALQDRYEAARALEKYRGRVAVLLAGRDIVVPTHYGQKLFDGYVGAKQLWIQAEAGHNTLNYDAKLKMWREVSDFLLSGSAS